MRLPFDPNAAEGAEPLADEPKPYRHVGEAECLTVGQLSEIIKSTLEQRIPSPIRVTGQVSNLNARNHWYFSLKDEEAVISCVAWASSARRFGFTPNDGDEVVAAGHVSHYGPQGKTQLYVSELKPVGAGELELRFRAMCAELRELGYFDEGRKRPMPGFPRRIAVITSAQSAAAQDVITTALHRCPAVALLLVDVRVQGEGAADAVAGAIRWIDARAADLDVEAILITRGGGSMEDLWAFNERVVADAVFGCRLPVAAAIGHESDTTVVELVADLRASTPTQAAMRLVPDAGELSRQVEHFGARLRLLVDRSFERHRARLRAASRHPAFRQPHLVLRPLRERLEHHRRHLDGAVRRLVADRRHRLERLGARQAALESRVVRLRDRLDQLEHRLAAVDPRHVLARGFSYTTHAADGSIVRRTDEVAGGETIHTHLADGHVESVVGRATRRPRRPGGKGRDQMDLFGRSG